MWSPLGRRRYRQPPSSLARWWNSHSGARFHSRVGPPSMWRRVWSRSEDRAGRRHPGEHAGAVPGPDLAGLGCGGAAPHRHREGVAVVVDDGGLPAPISLPVGDLAGDVGDHRSPPTQLTGVLGQPQQGAQIHGEVRPSPDPTACHARRGGRRRRQPDADPCCARHREACGPGSRCVPGPLPPHPAAGPAAAGWPNPPGSLPTRPSGLDGTLQTPLGVLGIGYQTQLAQQGPADRW